MTVDAVLAELKPAFEKAAAPYSHRPSALLALLHVVQEAYGYVSPESEGAVARFLDVGPNRVHEVVTFYTLYRQRPVGKYNIKLCRTLSCHVCGSPDLLNAVKRRLGIGEKEVTADGLFSLETVECLGCCDKSPAVQINYDPYLGPMTPESLEKVIDELVAKEAAEKEAREKEAVGNE